MKLLIIFIIFTIFNNCSLNKDSKYWTEESVNFAKEKFIKNNNKKKLPKILEKSDDIRNMTIEEYEIFINDHTKKSKYPNINK